MPIVTGSSSEPIIAEAATEVMQYSLNNGNPYMDFWALFGEFVDHGLAA
jgi:hypothetical protein